MKQKIHQIPKTSAPTQRALESAGINGLKDLTKVSEDELMQLHGMGQKALGILRETLKSNGLAFREPKKTMGCKMDKTIRAKMDDIFTGDGQTHFKAYQYLMKESEKPVSWAYDVWDECVKEKNGTLIRYDILVALRNLYDARTSSVRTIEAQRDKGTKRLFRSWLDIFVLTA